MFKKILKVISKILMGIFLFYMIAGFVIIPLAAKFIVPWQGTKILDTPVKCRSIFFNPFTLKLSVHELSIEDASQKPLVEFEELSVDVSFLKVFKKIVQVESVYLKGFFADAVLLSDGNINLLSLVPESEEKEEKDQEEQAEMRDDEESKEPPLVMVELISVENGSIHFTDQSVSPEFSSTMDQINIQITGFSTNPDDKTNVVFHTDLNEKGKIDLEVIIQPLIQPLNLEAILHFNNYAMDVLTPYVGKYTGKELDTGKLDLSMNYRIADNQLNASHKLTIQNFEFGSKVESPDALKLPFGLAVGLLEDSSGKISITLPVKGDMNDPQFEYLQLVGQVARNFFMKLVTKPFSILASLVAGEGGTEEFGSVKFVPGKSDISQEEKGKLTQLIAGLKERPRLKLGINGTYDPDVDWKAIQSDILEKNYITLRKESTKEELEVYQTLYQRHFGIRKLWKLTKQYDLKKDEDAPLKLLQEIKRQLIENAPADKEALSILADARAQMIYDFLVNSGFDEKRLSKGNAKKVQSALGSILVEFTLTVFGEEE